MRRPVFVALAAVAILAPIAACGVALSSARVRGAIAVFTRPLDVSGPGKVGVDGAPDSGVSLLPAASEAAGVESIELAALRNGASDAGAPLAAIRAPDPVLKAPLMPPSAPPRPRGLIRSPLTEREAEPIDQAIAGLLDDRAARAALLGGIKQMGAHRAELERVLRAWKVPDALVAVALTESAGLPAYVAGRNAGLWGLGMDAAAAYHLSVLPNYDERRAVNLSTECAAHYLADLFDRFGSWELSLFAYGNGYAAALAALDHARPHGTSATRGDFWSMAPDLPPSGVAYVAEVLAVSTLLGNQDRAGLEVRAEEPVLTSDLEVPAGAPFSAVAYAAGTSLDRLHALNPEYLSETVPTTGFAMMVHVPSAGLARAKELLIPLLYRGNVPAGGGALVPLDAGVPEAGAATVIVDDQTTVVRGGGQGHIFYRVNEGDTIETIARKFGVAPGVIATDNVLDPTARLAAGALLTLRVDDNDAGSPVAATRPDTPARLPRHSRH